MDTNATIGTRTYFEAMGASDHDTNPQSFVIGYFLNYSDAEAAAKGEGGWGTNGKVKKVTGGVVFIGDRIYALGDEIASNYVDPKDIKKRALEKLTDEEKEVLGLKG